MRALLQRSVEFVGCALIGVGITGFVFSAILVFDACYWPWDPEVTQVSVANTTEYSFAIRGLGTCAGMIALGLIFIFPRTLAMFLFPFRFLRKEAAGEQTGYQFPGEPGEED